ncbi:NmrA/HSCARG family protein [Streptomyces sp. NPDC020983]|uniref:NmrA/HSCARG family protein n=1 Tax=Streptomyces sp. NPDC020983 TaxID=3365106 RepID=UPI00379F7D56
MTTTDAHTRRTILVTGATGNQGGAVVAGLLARGWQVRALTRTPASRAARELARAGAEIAAGSAADPASLKAAMEGVYGVFSVQPGALGSPPVPYETEIRWGCAVAEAAAAAGAGHVVYSSVAGADRSAGVAAFEAKLVIERYIRQLGLPATVVRPVSFVENYADPAFGLGSGTLATPLAATVPEQLIALADVGAFVAMAFAAPGEYLGRTLTLAGDELTPPEIAAAISRATGEQVSYLPVPLAALREHNPVLGAVIAFLNDGGGYGADLTEARRRHPGALTFDAWLAAGGAARLTALLTHRTR